ncbi:MAG: hypothetical protein B7Y45_14025 [Sphingomonas sp. 28-66-16]|nr:MAG: hypothetical protein B7Y45_14025 [Sphingomonas sp. 28-66-16]
MCRDAHAFRGEYIDVCAQIENWALEMIDEANDGQKLPYLFGQKLKKVGQLAAGDTLFSKPMRVRELLERLKPFAELRSKLAHALVQPGSPGTDPIFAFEMPGAPSPPDDTGRFWLRLSDMNHLISELKKLRKELADQKIKRPPNT